MFLLFGFPPTEQGEWWSSVMNPGWDTLLLSDEMGETVWERPEGFVIPLTIIQVTFTYTL